MQEEHPFFSALVFYKKVSRLMQFQCCGKIEKPIEKIRTESCMSGSGPGLLSSRDSYRWNSVSRKLQRKSRICSALVVLDHCWSAGATVDVISTWDD